MPRMLIKLWLFLSSYSLLIFIFSLLQYKKHPYVAISLFIIASFSVIITIVYLQITTKKLGSISKKVTDFKKKDGELASYIVTYLVPFLSLSISSIPEVSALLILVLVIFILYTNSDMLYVNPIFSILKFKIYEAKIGEDINIVLITRRSQWKPDHLGLVSLGDQIYIESSKQ